MNSRKELERGTVLHFPGMQCCIEKTLGMGSNAIVYTGWYRDHLHQQEKHDVLIKELFPLHPQGLIWRDEKGMISVEGAEASALFELHRESFEAGNRFHLQLLHNAPESLGANLNSFEYNGTLYSVLGCSGGRSLLEELSHPSRGHDLRSHVRMMIKLLDALEVFHENGYLHLDISPDNMLLIGKPGREQVLLIDYNSVRKTGGTGTSWLSCKDGYSAPEVETGDQEEICEASDLYSVAAVFFRCLMQRELTLEEMLSSELPDVHDSLYLQNAPQTVLWQVRRILGKGLCTIVEERYQSIGALRRDFQELQDRIDSVGVTHWSLWEGGRKSVDELIRRNPSLSYVRNNADLYPIRVEYAGECFALPDFLNILLSPGGRCTLVVSQGGMGKTTALLKASLLQNKTYQANRTAAFYLSLSGKYAQDPRYIRSQLLTYMRFKRGTVTFDTAMHELEQLLDRPLRTRAGEGPSVLLLLDGLNEIEGDPGPLMEEIRMLSGLRGVRILAATRSEADELGFERCSIQSLGEEDIENAASARGVLLPQDQALLALMKTPLILSIYLKASENRQQLLITTQDELIEAYLQSLADKELDRLKENAPEAWRMKAAMAFVLPAVAAQTARDGSALERSEMLQAVEECYRTLTSGYFSKVFPEWIGHSRDILGGCTSADEWYGLIVDELLWQRLGLIIIDGEGRCRVFHQVIRDSLLPLHQANAARIRRRKTLSRSLLALPATVLLLAAFWIYAAFFMVTPYDDADVDIVLGKGQEAYNQYFGVFEELYTLLEVVQDDEKPVYLRYRPDRTQEKPGARELTPFELQYSNVQTALSQVDLEKERLEEIMELAVQDRKVVSGSSLPLDADSMMELYGFLWEKKVYYERSFLPELKKWYYRSNLAENPGALLEKDSYDDRCYQTALEMAKLDARYCMFLYDSCISVHLTQEDMAKYAWESAYYQDQDLKKMLLEEYSAADPRFFKADLKADWLDARSRWDELMKWNEENPLTLSGI